MRKTNIKIDSNSLVDNEITSAVNFVDKFNSVFDLLTKKTNIPSKVTELVKKREEARKTKDWNEADLLRNQILEMGWIIEDKPDGFKLKPALGK
jgi:cysteinyl-tRNA synthetase